MTLRVVIPPHPLIGHWLSILRIESTPSPIYSTALEQLGKWLTYEALRDWLPNSKREINTKQGKTEGILIETQIPLIIIPNLPGGLQMWQGAREILPNASLCLGCIPQTIERNAGIIVYCDQIDSGKNLLQNLERLKTLGVESPRIRIITALASTYGLKEIGENFPDLKIYAASVDPTLSENGEIIPGIGNPSLRLNTIITPSH
ncbi:Uracil phosphoribosyltransferase [Prochlorococcus marinus str. SS2]|nr:Uracil phosphoribosyltransferase [Prochlorococcus marinus str. LG]KGG18826.1 Uracil phosphoribosyltransferase [Prochlorococcus marinus str. SS2]KGG23636.1 Uracil phosphoribosyltransferase [Prochlorococcus marinus str. SS35]